jgi:hypothetical protein
MDVVDVVALAAEAHRPGAGEPQGGGFARQKRMAWIIGQGRHIAADGALDRLAQLSDFGVWLGEQGSLGLRAAAQRLVRWRMACGVAPQERWQQTCVERCNIRVSRRRIDRQRLNQLVIAVAR